MNFESLKLIKPLCQVLSELKYIKPTPIQEQAIPKILEGQDLLGVAQTGTGKTAAFCLPLLQLLHNKAQNGRPGRPKVLILSPTRELASQIHSNLSNYSKYTKTTSTVIFGGVSQGPQVLDLERGVDIVVATPGRLIDLLDQRLCRLDDIQHFVLDEADRMLDMGFLPEINAILAKLPPVRQNLFFSATMPEEIKSLAQKILSSPSVVEVTPPATTVEKVDQKALFVDKPKKTALLLELLKDSKRSKVLVFVSMKHVANRLGQRLEKAGIRTSVLHGDKGQTGRQQAIDSFQKSKVRVLIATDLAARGIDIEGITDVINFDLSHIAENYVHRIGRTARAGASGVALSLVTADEKSYLANIERTIQQAIPVMTDHPFHSEEAMTARVISVGKAKAKIEAEAQVSLHPGKKRRGR